MNLSPYLKLEVVSSASLSKGQIITINTLGLFGTNISLREKDNPGQGLDGYTFFGTDPSVIQQVNDGQPQHEDAFQQMRQKVVNDFVIPSRFSDKNQ